MSQALIEAFKTRLTTPATAGTLAAALPGGITQDEVAPNALRPNLVFKIGPMDIVRSFDGSAQHSLRITLEIRCDKSEGSEAIGDLEKVLYDLLNGATLTVTGFDRGLITWTTRFERETDEDSIIIRGEVLIRATMA